jgi:hypothetical protein
MMRKRKLPQVGAVILEFGTGRGNRTPTLLPELDFESSASTNSAIPAMGASKIAHSARHRAHLDIAHAM